MRFTVPLTLLLAVAAKATAGIDQDTEPVALAERAGAEPIPIEARGEVPDLLEKRACTYNGCKCDSRGKQLTVCGACRWGAGGPYVVTTKRVLDHIYECSPSGRCCDYGKGSDCNTGSGRCIVN